MYKQIKHPVKLATTWQMFRVWTVLAALLLAVIIVASLGPLEANAQATLPSGFHEEVVLSGLTDPTNVEFTKDGRIFVAEKSGLIKVFDDLNDKTPTTFADLRTQVYNFWDRGLLGLALDPDFPATPYVYVLYTYDKDPSSTKVPRWGTVTTPGEPAGTSDPCPTPPGATTDGCVVSGRLSRPTASGDVMTGQEEPLLTDWCQQFPSHSVGSLAFGADGKLYVSGGEGAGFFFADYGQTGSFYRPENNPCLDPPTDSTPEPPGAEGGARS